MTGINMTGKYENLTSVLNIVVMDKTDSLFVHAELIADVSCTMYINRLWNTFNFLKPTLFS